MRSNSDKGSMRACGVVASKGVGQGSADMMTQKVRKGY